MALDGIFLYTIKEELKNKLLNLKVDKINQPEKDEILVTFRGNKKLLISASSSYPRIYLTKTSKENPMKAPMFCMVLRKYLLNSRLIDLKQLDGDRILIFKFESTDELGFDSIYNLVIEIMGRHSNITLVRERDNIIMDSIKHITPAINSYRCLYPSIQYVSAPKSNKLNTQTFTLEELNNLSNSLEINDKTFSMLFTGVSKPLSKELFLRFNQTSKNLYDFSKEFFNDFYSNKNLKFLTYLNNENILKDFYCTPLSFLYDYKTVEFESGSELLDNYYLEKDRQDRLNSRTLDIQKVIHTNMDRCNKKIKILEDNLDKCKEKESVRIKGELLTANIYSIKLGMNKISLLNYYNMDKEEYIEISLDENKSPSENVQIYYKKYNKYKKAEESALIQLDIAHDEILYLTSVLNNLNNIDSYDEIDEVRSELMESGYLRFKKNNKKKRKLSKPMHFVSSEGYDIYVGKNNIQNDYLTLKFADKHNIWMHTKNIPGSHVIIKGFNIPDTTLLEAANLAAFYSKAKTSSKVPVDYTEVKNVRKPSGSKPGMVIYYTNKTIYMDPTEPTIDKA